MIDIATIRAALANPNVAAFLRIIREGESAQDATGYYLRYHPHERRFFDDTSDHPRAFEPTPDGRRSSAAGAYQITATTWDGLRANYPGVFVDFRPAMQDLAAVALIAGRGALEDVLAGDVAVAIAKCAPEWASLPGGVEDGHDRHLRLDRCLQVYDSWGGFRGPAPQTPEVRLEPADAPVVALYPDSSAATQDTQTAGREVAPPDDANHSNSEDQPMALPLPLLTVLLSKAAEVIPEIASLVFDKSKTIPERNVGIATKIIGKIVETTGAPNEQAAVDKITRDTSARVAARDALGPWLEVAEVGGGIAAARESDVAFRASGGHLYESPSFIVALLLIPLVYIAMISASFKFSFFPDWPSDIRIAVISGVVGTVLGAVTGFYFGTMTSRNRTPS